MIDIKNVLSKNIIFQFWIKFISILILCANQIGINLLFWNNKKYL